MGLLRELLVPADDRLVAAEAVVVLLVVVGLGWRWRRRPDRRLLVWGSGLVVVGLMAVRALH